MDADVVVLGAGFAGVAAARNLQEAGTRVVILEARDRIGGRTWYREMPGAGVSAEYGGMFFSRATQPHLAAEIERYGIAVTPPVEPELVAWIRGDERHEGMAAIERIQSLLASSQLMTALETTAKAFAAGERAALDALDITSAAWVDALDADPEAADYLRAFLVAMGGSSIERTSVLPLLWDMVELDYTPADAYVDMGELFTDGTKSLIDAMAAGLDVRLGTVATRVVAEADGVTVTTQDGSVIRAGAAIVALPLNVWADVVFDPPLAAPKQRAATQRHPGAVSKVLAVVSDAPASYLGAGWGTPINAGFITKAAGVNRAVHGLLGPGSRGSLGPRRRRGRGERPPAAGNGRRDRRARLGRRPVLERCVVGGASRPGSAMARSRRCESPRAAWPSPGRISPPRVRDGSKARSRAASPPRRITPGSHSRPRSAAVSRSRRRPAG